VFVGSKPAKDEITSDYQSQNLFLLDFAGLKPANDEIYFFSMKLLRIPADVWKQEIRLLG
jgi:hypothetical protein